MKDPLLQEYEDLLKADYIRIIFRTIILGKTTKIINDTLANKLLNDITNLTIKLNSWHEKASKAQNDD